MKSRELVPENFPADMHDLVNRLRDDTFIQYLLDDADIQYRLDDNDDDDDSPFDNVPNNLYELLNNKNTDNPEINKFILEINKSLLEKIGLLDIHGKTASDGRLRRELKNVSENIKKIRVDLFTSEDSMEMPGYQGLQGSQKDNEESSTRKIRTTLSHAATEYEHLSAVLRSDENYAGSSNVNDATSAKMAAIIEKVNRHLNAFNEKFTQAIDEYDHMSRYLDPDSNHDNDHKWKIHLNINQKQLFKEASRLSRELSEVMKSLLTMEDGRRYADLPLTDKMQHLANWTNNNFKRCAQLYADFAILYDRLNAELVNLDKQLKPLKLPNLKAKTQPTILSAIYNASVKDPVAFKDLVTTLNHEIVKQDEDTKKYLEETSGISVNTTGLAAAETFVANNLIELNTTKKIHEAKSALRDIAAEVSQLPPKTSTRLNFLDDTKISLDEKIKLTMELLSDSNANDLDSTILMVLKKIIEKHRDDLKKQADTKPHELHILETALKKFDNEEAKIHHTKVSYIISEVGNAITQIVGSQSGITKHAINALLNLVKLKSAQDINPALTDAVKIEKMDVIINDVIKHFVTDNNIKLSRHQITEINNLLDPNNLKKDLSEPADAERKMNELGIPITKKETDLIHGLNKQFFYHHKLLNPEIAKIFINRKLKVTKGFKNTDKLIAELNKPYFDKKNKPQETKYWKNHLKKKLDKIGHEATPEELIKIIREYNVALNDPIYSKLTNENDMQDFLLLRKADAITAVQNTGLTTPELLLNNVSRKLADNTLAQTDINNLNNYFDNNKHIFVKNAELMKQLQELRARCAAYPADQLIDSPKKPEADVVDYDKNSVVNIEFEDDDPVVSVEFDEDSELDEPHSEPVASTIAADENPVVSFELDEDSELDEQHSERAASATATADNTVDAMASDDAKKQEEARQTSVMFESIYVMLDTLVKDVRELIDCVDKLLPEDGRVTRIGMFAHPDDGGYTIRGKPVPGGSLDVPERRPSPSRGDNT